MTNRQFLINVTCILNHLHDPTDMERWQILSRLEWSIKERLCKRYKASDEEMNSAWELTKARIEKVKEAGF